MHSCSKCNKSITKRNPGVSCAGFCEGDYHANGTCSDIKRGQLAVIKELPGAGWKCVSCRGNSLDSRCDSRSGAAVPSPPSLPRPSLSRSDFPREIRDLASDEYENVEAAPAGFSSFIGHFTKEMKDLRKSVNFCSDKITDFELKLLQFGEVISKVSRLEKENDALKKEVSLLSNKNHNIEQQNRQNNMEVQNVPCKPGENLVEMVSKIGSVIGVRIDHHSIDYVARVPTKIKDKHKNIVVKFLSKNKRDDFLTAYRKKRQPMGATQSGMTVRNVAEKIFINEHLTLANKIIFKETRTIAEGRGYKYVWTQGGNVLVRKDATSRIIHISSEADFDRL